MFPPSRDFTLNEVGVEGCSGILSVCRGPLTALLWGRSIVGSLLSHLRLWGLVVI